MARTLPVNVRITFSSELVRQSQRDLLELERELLFDPIERRDTTFEITRLDNGLQVVPELIAQASHEPQPFCDTSEAIKMEPRFE